MGAFVGYRLPIPAGVLLGTLVAVGAVSLGGTLLGFPKLPVPPGTRELVQILLGMMAGLRMDRESLRSGARALLPASLLAAVIIPTAIVAALLTAPLTSADTSTTIFAASPGGLNQMTLVGASFGADGAAVATVQLVRLLLAITIVDIVLKKKGGSEDEPEDEADSRQEERDDEGQGDAPAGKSGHLKDLKRLGVAAPWGVLGGVIGLLIWMPAGGIIGALVGSAAFGLLTGRPVPLGKFQTGVQAFSGLVVGLDVSSDFLSGLARLAVPGALIILIQLLLWLAMSWLLAKFFDYNLPTSALAASPAGSLGIIPAASETGADTVIVTFIHLVRLSTIVIVVPVFVTLFLGR